MSPALSLRRVDRRFGTVQALLGVDLDFEPGQVHAVLGENGAGKSTAIRILAGLDQPDSGSVELAGSPVRLRTRDSAVRRGIGLIPQTGSLLGELTLIENLALTQPRQLIRRRHVGETLEAAAASSGLTIDVDTPVRRLGRAQQQLGELAIMVAQGARILLLDEPTSVLDADEIHGLHRQLRVFADTGITVVLITHRLHEVRAVADAATVLSHGTVAWTGRVADVDDVTLARSMVGDLPESAPPPRQPIIDDADPALVLDRVWAATDDLAPVRDVTVRVRPGEVVAVVGTAGSGQRTLAEVAAGVVTPERGARRVTGRASYIPERRSDALLSGLPVKWSAVLPRLKDGRFTRFGMVREDAVDEFARDLLGRFDVRPPNPDLPAGALSGGNAQKLVMGRELDTAPAVAVVHAPTQGLDLLAAQRIRDLILTTAAAGAAVLLISADHEEARALADRVLVLRDGRIVGEHTAADYDHAVHRLVDVPLHEDGPA
ncbi:heme ABC transporter ATP-binding protein [Amycolatopsis thailandensis]|uniref:Heme ABC transporter ATP-binding protein n=1 Tax=Amycolatopsis thailandensis TaxID=589330 RepID=A0A229RCQ9_9PSEU|nr:ATP-binding cassette domain-containing protein [Amycolatopsis thailandensis]OXM44279.1 heme ABC transporter ATP-binding protein [Amycolatopsis thailandensis]